MIRRYAACVTAFLLWNQCLLSFARENCGVVTTGRGTELRGPNFVYRLTTTNGLRADSWENRLTGRTINLGGGSELEFDIDAADSRIWISGWRVESLQDHPSKPNEEKGFVKEFYRPELDDSKWRGIQTCAPDIINFPEWKLLGPDVDQRYFWTRTHVFLPANVEGKPLSLTLGGVGLFDLGYMRVFVNGREIGVRNATEKWNEPGVFDLGPDSPVYPHLRFGQDNIIAVQSTKYRVRTERMDKLDPRHMYHMIGKCFWPGQFEQYLTVGKPFETARLEVVRMQNNSHDDSGEVVFHVRAAELPLSAKITYRWDSAQPVLHKYVEITNNGQRECRVLNVRLGNYDTDADVSDGEQGFPVYLNDECFLSLAHPSGWATGQKGQVRLRHYPGKKLAAGQTFPGMETVLGVAASHQGRPAFLAHVRDRCRRVSRGHDKPYAIYENFGSWPIGEGQGNWCENTEQAVLASIDQLAKSQPPLGPAFDFFSIEFWLDMKGDFQRFAPKQFPNGLRNILPELNKLNMAPGLWIASSLAEAIIGENPVTRPALTDEQAYKGTEWPILCRAADPVKGLFTSAFLHHIRNNKVRLLKFDGLFAICCNSHHDHLPGLYSTEAIHSTVVEFLNTLDAECRDVFLMLYWGHRSPWWLLHADTLFEPGLGIEAASPGLLPALHVRDSVIVGLDQAQAWCQDVPTLGKDSLGVWLSDWWWNSSIGKENWQEGFVVDMCRGSLLAQIWSDRDWLSPPERKQLAEFIAVLKANPGCFAHPKTILGDPWKFEPYGYCCSDGKKAFIVVNNCTWSDQRVRLELNAAWSLLNSQTWDIYRRYPNPAQLTVAQKAGEKDHASICLRPFEIMLLEVVPAGQSPNPTRAFAVEPAPQQFAEPAQELEIAINAEAQTFRGSVPVRIDGSDDSPKHALKITGRLPASRRGGILALSAEMSQDTAAKTTRNIGEILAIKGRIGGNEAACEPAAGKQTYPTCWQVWRVPVRPDSQPQDIEMELDVTIKETIDLSCRVFFIPASQN